MTTDRYLLSTSLRIQGSSELDLATISHILNTSASRTIKKGTLSEIGRPYEVSTWILDSELPESDTLDSHLRWFSQKFPDAKSIRNMRDLPGVQDVDIFCAVSTISPALCIKLPAETLVILQTMQVDLEFSLVFGDMLGSDDVQLQQEPSWSQNNLEERSCAGLRMTLTPYYQAVMEDELRSSLERDSLSSATTLSEITMMPELVLQTQMKEGSSLDLSLQRLNDSLHNSLQQLLEMAKANTFRCEITFETNAEWLSTRLSHQSLDFPVSLGCSVTVEAALMQ